MWLRDHLGEGHDAVAIGRDAWGCCSYDTYLWDPFVPRGTHRAYDDAIALVHTFECAYEDIGAYDPGDVDMDGEFDLVYAHNSIGQIAKGPYAGKILDTSTDLGFGGAVLNGVVTRTMGDVNGDGAPELLGQWRWGNSTTTSIVTENVWVLLCSPFELPIDLATGIVLVDLHGAFGSFIGKASADLDGDGLHDLVDNDEEGLSIWYGADLAAACQAQESDEN